MMDPIYLYCIFMSLFVVFNARTSVVGTRCSSYAVPIPTYSRTRRFRCTHVQIYLASRISPHRLGSDCLALPKETSSFSGKRFQQVSAVESARKGGQNKKYLWWRWWKEGAEVDDDDEDDNNRLEYFIVQVEGLEGVYPIHNRSDLFVFVESLR